MSMKILKEKVHPVVAVNSPVDSDVPSRLAHRYHTHNLWSMIVGSLFPAQASKPTFCMNLNLIAMWRKTQCKKNSYVWWLFCLSLFLLFSEREVYRLIFVNSMKPDIAWKRVSLLKHYSICRQNLGIFLISNWSGRVWDTVGSVTLGWSRVV